LPHYGQLMKAHIKFADGTASPEQPERADQIELIDESLRKSFSGMDTETVLPELERSLEEIGVKLPADQLHTYARAISDREDFELLLP
jgi:hypothetical protein